MGGRSNSVSNFKQEENKSSHRTINLSVLKASQLFERISSWNSNGESALNNSTAEVLNRYSLMRREWKKEEEEEEEKERKGGKKLSTRREEQRGKENRCAERSGNYTRAEPGRMSRTLAGSWFERVTGGRAGNIGYIRADTGRLVSITIAPPNLVFYASVEMIYALLPSIFTLYTH